MALIATWLSVGTTPVSAGRPKAQKPPNILFIILDDVGRDQLRIFNPLAGTAPHTPNIDAVAAEGVRFTNLTAMPECSPSRATFFTGRYPFRTGVNAAILSDDLAGAQLSPYEITTPKVLRKAGYRSALFGKYHLGGPDNNPDTYRTPRVEGWDYYNGNLQGGPPFIDESLGGQYTTDKTRYSCGYPVGTQQGGCWFVDDAKKGTARFDDNGGQGFTGKQCVTKGGIPALDANGDFTLACSPSAGCKEPDFSLLNGYYTWNQTINNASALRRATVREYMTTFQTNAAIDWITKQSKGARARRPWMATVSYDAIHTPYQAPPDELIPAGFQWPEHVSEDCTSFEAVRILSNLMLEAMDKEIGRLLVSTGLATYGVDGALIYTPEGTNTMVVIVGDNGTYFSSVKYPYNLTRAKGTPYETGIVAPLVVAGPQVVAPNREVDAMLNSVDLFQLFGEIAGVDVRAVVPSQHVLDSQPVRPYLAATDQQEIRQLGFTQLGDGLKASTTKLWPCVLQAGPSFVCTDILFTSEDLCKAELGAWYGPSDDDPSAAQFATCCDLAVSADAAVLYPNGLTIVPTSARAIRNDRYKLVWQDRAACDPADPYEFYDLTPRPGDAVNPLGIDNAADDLLQQLPLTSDQTANRDALSAALDQLLNSEVSCPGDGNLDKRVNVTDRRGVRRNRERSSVFDFDVNGITNRADMKIVEDNFGTVCVP
jgi:arylsulfatase A-like enzyme